MDIDCDTVRLYFDRLNRCQLVMVESVIGRQRLLVRPHVERATRADAYVAYRKNLMRAGPLAVSGIAAADIRLERQEGVGPR